MDYGRFSVHSTSRCILRGSGERGRLQKIDIVHKMFGHKPRSAGGGGARVTCRQGPSSYLYRNRSVHIWAAKYLSCGRVGVGVDFMIYHNICPNFRRAV
ncbi:uncharacterized protein YALI1_A06196g [Yarrowia lipolytica]|uniref:Uncharacterized protein n=1 Tax=Yarrowia lipolytica TaxID=4952 RepID=A0A1D8N3V9_YARLL|nr:hypothetical protein YALI1_A06196g [Yarrowia lipolytica]